MVTSLELSPNVVSSGASKLPVKAAASRLLDSAPVASLPEDIPLDALKVICPSDLGKETSSSSEDEADVVTKANGAAASKVVSDTLVLGKNFHDFCLTITEPEFDDDVTGEKDAYMAGVLAHYRKTLVERTKYQLGMRSNLELFHSPVVRSNCG